VAAALLTFTQELRFPMPFRNRHRAGGALFYDGGQVTAVWDAHFRANPQSPICNPQSEGANQLHE